MRHDLACPSRTGNPSVPFAAADLQGPVCLLPDAADPGMVTVLLAPGVSLRVMELQRLGDKCIVQLCYTVGEEVLPPSLSLPRLSQAA